MAVMDQYFEHRGIQYRRITAEADERFVAGLDVGQSADPSALSVIHHRRVPLETWTEVVKPNGTGTLRQDIEETFDVVHLERLPLQMSYVDQVDYVTEALARSPLNSHADFVLDQTGCGAPVGDLFDHAGLKPIRVVITAGLSTEHHGRKWGVPKHELISGLDAALHSGTLRFADGLIEAGAMKGELKDFRRHVTAAGRSTFSARSGKHDDLVLSCAIALWWCGRWRRQQVRVGVAIGHY
jgi:hypothetical protein